MWFSREHLAFRRRVLINQTTIVQVSGFVLTHDYINNKKHAHHTFFLR